MEKGWKSERIEKILVFLICVGLGGWKSGGMENFFCLVRKRNEMIENGICINLLICPY